VVVDSDDAVKALRAAHSGFYLSAKTISIGLIGPGTVGTALLRQIEKQSEKLRQNFNIDLRVRAISRSRKMLLGDRRIDLATWEDDFASSAREADLDVFEQHLNPDHLPHAVIIDCTASDQIASKYAEWLAKGIHVITPNKKAFSNDYGDYQALQDAADEGSSHYFYETTVGAALPVITTLCDLIHTGDEVRSIRGIFSGTLAYLFNVYDGSTPFSEIVRVAKDSGYTEPDPRDDLSGMDVARKLTILARELGQKIEIGDFPVKNLVPEALRDCSVDEFLQGLPAYDDEMEVLYQNAAAENKQLRYVANLDADGTASVGLEAVDASHPFCNINLTDNIVQFETERYSDNPLVIQGPGAGPEVTAAGVFADLLRLANFLSTGEGKDMSDSVSAFAPASIGNVGVGFDMLGLALAGAGDRVIARRTENGRVSVAEVRGLDGEIHPLLSTNADENTASIAAQALWNAHGDEGGVELKVHKGVPLQSGMGSSAASAVAAVVAVNALLESPLEVEALLPYALEGEKFASGGMHTDNVAPSLLGGLILSPEVLLPEIIRLPTPKGVSVVLMHPDLQVNTATARRALPKSISIKLWLDQQGLLAGFIHACATGDIDLISRSLRDVVIVLR